MTLRGTFRAMTLGATMTGMTSVTDTTAADRADIEQIIAGRHAGRRPRRHRREVRRPPGVQRQGRRPRRVADAHLAADVRRGPRRRGGARRPRRRAGTHGRDHGHQPHRAPGRRHGRGARRRRTDVDLQHALPGADRLHRRPVATGRGVRGDRRPPRALAHGADLRGRRARRRRHRGRRASTTPRFVTWDAFVARGARRAEGRRRRAQRRARPPTTPPTILYTSGTTGDPKGVVLSHRNVLFGCESGLRISGLSGTNRTVSYLPYAAHRRADPEPLHPAVLRRRPHPPRRRPVAAARRARSRSIPRSSSGSRGSGRRSSPACPECSRGSPTPARRQPSRPRCRSAPSTSSRSRSATPPRPSSRHGTTRRTRPCSARSRRCSASTRWSGPASASAPMPLDVARFFAGLGIAIYDIWGMTETCGGATACGPGAFKLGTRRPRLPRHRAPASPTTASSSPAARS